MKILIVSEFFPTGNDLRFTGGVEARNYYISKHLAKKHQVTVLTSKLSGSKPIETMSGFKIMRVGRQQKYQATVGNILGRLLFIKSAIYESSEIDADIVEGTNFISHFIAYQIGRRKNIPTVAWYPDVWLGSWVKNSGIVGIFGEFLERVNLKLGFKKYIAISQQTKEKLQKYTKAAIAVIPCGLEPSEFQGIPVKKTNTIICISRLTKYKNIKDLIYSFAFVHKDHPSLSLTIVGRGPEENNLKSLVKNLKIQKNTKFLSNLKRKDLIKLIKSSAVFCLPSQVEGFGISIIESAAAKTPYVVSEIPVFEQITKKYQGGLSYPVGAINSLSRQLNLLLTDKKLYEKKTTECQKLALHYNWGRIARQTEKQYLSLL